MAHFSVTTNFRPKIGIAEIPVYYRGNVVANGVLLKDGTFSYQLMDPEVIETIEKGDAQIILTSTEGHFFADINHSLNRSSSMG